MLNTVFSRILDGCYSICGNYGLAILFFTLISKVILLPVSVWVQKNSIKMVKLMPEVNRARARHFGDKDAIAEAEQKIYRDGGYNPLATVIPTVIQIVLLLGLIGAIRSNMQAGGYETRFLGIDLNVIPAEQKGWLILFPIFAGLSSYLLCLSQNRSNVLQKEQGRGMQYGTMAFSVGLSLVLGWFVSAGVVLYWVSSNLMSIVQQYLLNRWIDPEKYVDYETLEASRQELDKLNRIGSQGKRPTELIRREKADYKRFFSIENKHLVFYSESSGFYKYYKGIIEYLLKNTNIIIHYITSDPEDAVFRYAGSEPQLRPYYIGEKKLITLMMKMDADIVVMTMPDLDNYHIKRSYVSKDIEYIFIPHSMCSLNLTMRTASIDHFDAVFCTGKHQREETEKTEAAYDLPKKKLVDWGYCLLDDMRAEYRRQEKTEMPEKEKKILIAPSWQKDNIVDSCLDTILDSLKGTEYRITVRPHPQHVRHQPERMQMLKEKYASYGKIEIQTDFSSNDTVYEANMMITDWSGIAYEYAFTTYKPVLFIDTPLKIMNPEYKKIDTEPFNIWMRDVLGRVIRPEDASMAAAAVEELLASADAYRETIRRYAHEYVYHLDHSSEVGAEYIIQELRNIIQQKRARK